MFVLRSSIVVKKSKKIFRIINKPWGMVVQISTGGRGRIGKKFKKLKSGVDIYLAVKSSFLQRSYGNTAPLKMLETLPKPKFIDNLIKF